MIKSKNPLFNKTFHKKAPILISSQQHNQNKTRRSYFKLSRTNPNLTSIIQNLQKNVNQLKNYHQSLQKINTNKLQKSNSLTQINKFRCSTKHKLKSYGQSSTTRKINPVRDMMANKENRCPNSKDQIIQSTVSKYLPQNGSTMLSVLNADVDEVKKAYVQTYGKQNGNIVDLYNFFKKNVQKSTRYHGGSIQISSYAHGQHSEYLKKSRQNLPRKSNDFLNIIVEDKQQKQLVVQSQNKTEKETSLAYKTSSQKNPTMEEIFKNGCPDLANVYDFVKKRRVSLKNYMNLNKAKESNNQNKIDNQKIQMKKKSQPAQIRNEKDFYLKVDFMQENESTPLFENSPSQNKKFSIEQSQISNKKYLPSKSSKKSQKSSIKKSKQKNINLDQNIQDEDINMFNFGIQEIDHKEKQVKKQQHFDFIVQNQNQKESKQMELKYEKFKKSKYYVEPVPLQKQNSLEGCSISLKSSSRIIDLDFIPLDL